MVSSERLEAVIPFTNGCKVAEGASNSGLVRRINRIILETWPAEIFLAFFFQLTRAQLQNPANAEPFWASIRP